MFHVTRGSGTPLLLVHGFCVDHRLLLTLDDRYYPHATTAVLDRAGHNVHLDQPALTALSSTTGSRGWVPDYFFSSSASITRMPLGPRT